MPARRGTLAGPVAAGILVLAIVGVLVYASDFAPNPIAPGGPEIAPPPTALIRFANASTAFSGDRTIYSFNLTEASPNVTWRQVVFTVVPGPLSGAPTNWTLRVVNASTGEYYSFSPIGENWTCPLSDPIRLGEVVVLTVDSPMTEGSLEASWPSLGPGSYRVTIS